MSTISLTYDGDEIIQDVIIADAQFESQANGVAGLCKFRVKDDQHTYEPGYFHTGGVLELRVDGVLVWSGKVVSVSRNYAFSVDDTTVPSETPRFWVIEGVDWNILFAKRVVWNQNDPTGERPMYAPSTPDNEVILELMNDWMDLEEDGISTAGVMHVGPISPYGEEFMPLSTVGEQWGSVMNRIVQANGAIFYIDPDKVLQYRDVEAPTAPFVLSDTPQDIPEGVGYREMVISSSATELANDAMVWGAGLGSDQVAFARIQDQDSIDEFGLFQWGDFRHDVYLAESVERRARSHVYGSDTSKRGHREPHTEVTLTMFTPGLRVGMVVDFKSFVFDESVDDDWKGEDIYQPVPSDPPVAPSQAAFAARIAKIESNGRYEAQNRHSGAMGKYQIMPGNWRAWGCDFLGYPRSQGVSGKYLPVAQWFPPTTPSNQETVANTKFSRLYQWLGDWRRVAACWRSGGSVAVRQPSEWSRGTIFYVNHACEPLGFPPVTTSTVLPPVGSTDIQDVAGQIGFIWNTTGGDIIPVRRCVITFPTPTDVRFEYLLTHVYDQAYAMADPYPTTPWDPIDNPWMTEVVPINVPPPYGVGDEYTKVTYSGGGGTRMFRRNGSAGEAMGNAAYSAIYSAVGVHAGFAATVPWPYTLCDVFDNDGEPDVHVGGWTGHDTGEMWFPIGPALSDPNESWELTWTTGAASGVAAGVDVRFRRFASGYTPTPSDADWSLKSEDIW